MTCTCGHDEEDHGHDPKLPGSTACHFDGDDPEDCECIAFEPDDEGEETSATREKETTDAR